MPKHHKKRSHKPHRKHASGHHHKHAGPGSGGHHKRRHHNPGHGLPAQIREKLQQPVTVKTLRDIVALRRVQRGA